MNWRLSYIRFRLKHIVSKKSYLMWKYRELVGTSKACNNSLWTKVDYILANAMFGVEPEDYFRFCLYTSHNPFYRNHLVTRQRLNFSKSKLNDKSAVELFSSKAIFDEAYGNYLGRKWCLLDSKTADEFVDMFSNPDGFVICKPLDGYGGKGILKIPSDKEALWKLFQDLEGKRDKYIVEEYYEQKGLLHEINPSSLNTIRVTTLKIGNNIEVVYAYLRAGGKGSIVDNLHSGGVSYTIDIKNGLILPGVTYSECGIIRHPSSGVTVAGNIIPNWEKIIEYAIELHRHAPEGARLIGWDICISDNDLLVIEANTGPGFPADVDFTHNTWEKMRKALDAI
ncbi:sugar-transfer associated ATP-grasp domain-containing protein [Butyrivibrio sp. VCB2006]|uniref:sugar-transfer associated ATP-grasp domain-containing protein n=1 Tax=Butyrivibrio sp. VCB2006 TaxID=1280679 RepID=UPI000424623E|nr:sugar-transfer associated ATP-grasp domain-containing protein [Butyrivibrio sp. VCB2006]